MPNVEIKYKEPKERPIESVEVSETDIRGKFLVKAFPSDQVLGAISLFFMRIGIIMEFVIWPSDMEEFARGLVKLAQQQNEIRVRSDK